MLLHILHNRAVLFSILMAAIPSEELGHPPLYRVVDLGKPEGFWFDVTGISEAGHVIGWFETGERNSRGVRVRHGFLWCNGERRDLESLDGPLGSSVPYAVNSSGHVVGWADVGAADHAVLWLPEPAFGLPAGPNDLGVPSSTWAMATDINERSEIAVSSDSGVFLWLPYPALGMDAGLNRLCAQGSESVFNCWRASNAQINDLAQVAGGGWFWTPWPAFGRDAGLSQYWDSLDKDIFWERDFSDGGLIIGNIFYRMISGPGNYMAHWLSDDRTDIRMDLGQANGLNELEDIVGWAWNAETSMVIGFLKRRAHTEVIDLNDLLIYSDGWHIIGASDINNGGQIAAGGRLADDEYHAVLLDPVNPDLDRSGRVDLRDVSFFVTCQEGKFYPWIDCTRADLESDGDVDLKDFLVIQLRFEGSK